MQLFVYFDKHINEARELIKQELIELHNELRGVYSCKTGLLLFQVAEMNFRSSDLSEFACDAQIKGARTHVSTTRGNV